MTEADGGPRPRIPAWLWDASGSILVTLAVLPALREGPLARSVTGWVFALLPAALLLLRRRFPWAVLAGCVACFAVALFTFPLTPGAAFAVAIALYTVTVRTERKPAIWTAAVTAVILLLVVVIAREDLLGPGVVLVLLTVGFAAALGDAVRTRRAYIAEITQRAIRAEATREAEASRRVAEDRLHIARDLHDVVAHQISVISLNAGLAASALDERPEVARDALATIRSASRTVLGEIGDLLATLRMPGEHAVGIATVGLADLDAMIAGFGESRLDVSTTVIGDLADLPPAVDVVAYRVVQEALTNALKHGSAPRADVRLTRDDGSLRIVVANPVADAPSGTGGHGLAGVRERVASVRGRVRTSRDNGEYRLDAELPLGTAERPS